MFGLPAFIVGYYIISAIVAVAVGVYIFKDSFREKEECNYDKNVLDRIDSIFSYCFFYWTLLLPKECIGTRGHDFGRQILRPLCVGGNMGSHPDERRNVYRRPRNVLFRRLGQYALGRRMHDSVHFPGVVFTAEKASEYIRTSRSSDGSRFAAGPL